MCARGSILRQVVLFEVLRQSFFGNGVGFIEKSQDTPYGVELIV